MGRVVAVALALLACAPAAAAFADVTDLVVLRALACSTRPASHDPLPVDLAILAQGGRVRASLDETDRRLIAAAPTTRLALPLQGVENAEGVLLFADALDLEGSIPWPRGDDLARTVRLLDANDDGLARALLLRDAIPVREALLVADDPQDVEQFSEAAILALALGTQPVRAGRC